MAMPSAREYFLGRGARSRFCHAWLTIMLDDCACWETGRKMGKPASVWSAMPAITGLVGLLDNVMISVVSVSPAFCLLIGTDCSISFLFSCDDGKPLDFVPLYNPITAVRPWGEINQSVSSAPAAGSRLCTG